MTFIQKTFQPIIAASLLALVATTAHAQDSDWTGFYGGVSFGMGSLETNVPGVTESYSNLGLHAGYNHDLGDIILGAELEHAKLDFGFGTVGGSSDVTRLKLKGGYDMGRALPYVVVGTSRLSAAGMSDSFTTYGVGLDYKMSDTMRVGAEYLVDSSNGTFSTTGVMVDLSTINVRLSIGF